MSVYYAATPYNRFFSPYALSVRLWWEFDWDTTPFEDGVFHAVCLSKELLVKLGRLTDESHKWRELVTQAFNACIGRKTGGQESFVDNHRSCCVLKSLFVPQEHRLQHETTYIFR